MECDREESGQIIELVVENITDDQQALKAKNNNHPPITETKTDLCRPQNHMERKHVLSSTVLNNVELNIKQIVLLKLSFCNLVSLPEELTCLVALKEIYLSHNMFEIVPECVILCQYLESIDLSHNRLRQMPEPKCVKRLTHLNISHNLFTQLPFWFQKVKCFNLIEFDYSYNQMNHCVHSEYYKLSYFRLNKLQLLNCNLLQDDFEFLKTIHTLKYLDISNYSVSWGTENNRENLIMDIDELFIKPEWAEYLVDLKMCYLKLNFIGDEIGCLSNLRSLNLQGNVLTYICGGIFKLKNLKILRLSHNKIDGEICGKLTKLTNLEELYLAHNNIDACPNLSSMTKLRVIDLYDNEIMNLDNVLPLNFDLLYDLERNFFNVSEIKGYVSAREELRKLLNETERALGRKPHSESNLTALESISYESCSDYEDDQWNMEGTEACNENETFQENSWNDDSLSCSNKEVPLKCSQPYNEEESWDKESCGSSNKDSVVKGTLSKFTSSDYPSSDEEWSLPDNYSFFAVPRPMPLRNSVRFCDDVYEDI